MHTACFAASLPTRSALTTATATQPSPNSCPKQLWRPKLQGAQRRAYQAFLQQNGAHMHVAPVHETAQGNLFCAWSERIAIKMRVVQDYRNFLQSQQVDTQLQLLTTPVYITADNKLICDYPRRA
ncbi:hypothetical protein BWQ96_07888 [Gracilariopsis chorda]|uniref:Uncharacterized protein n=1 Tax=Gracilariopsis chorda TaxID=448386 RepID=A0A2V3IJZ3_9FLOR|nr:hypothetical protein BWQ96_07888 [Gracilariopsis chorda]|eukprot:PXF42368.1 hypothetical protein BWQ96_07888 [Gracilariopsis chorda]